MAKTKYLTASLNSSNSIKNLINQLRKYEDALNSRTKAFLEQLAEKGIHAARTSLAGAGDSGKYSSHITFWKEDEISGENVSIALYGDGGLITVEWQGPGGTIKSAEVNPMLMEEFGAWEEATVESYPMSGNKPSGVGRGTFPGQTHAFQADFTWKEVGSDKVQHATDHRAEMTPSRPMYNAAVEMKAQIIVTAREVFG